MKSLVGSDRRLCTVVTGYSWFGFLGLGVGKSELAIATVSLRDFVWSLISGGGTAVLFVRACCGTVRTWCSSRVRRAEEPVNVWDVHA